MHPIQLAAVGGLILAESAAQYFLQRAVKGPTRLNLVAGVILYAVVAVVYYVLLRSGDPMALANSVWNAGTEVSIALVGWAFFSQGLTRTQVAGLAVTIAGIQMLGSK